MQPNRFRSIFIGLFAVLALVGGIVSDLLANDLAERLGGHEWYPRALYSVAGFGLAVAYVWRQDILSLSQIPMRDAIALSLIGKRLHRC